MGTLALSHTSLVARDMLGCSYCCRTEHASLAVQDCGAEAAAAEAQKYSLLEATYLFVPGGVETLGPTDVFFEGVVSKIKTSLNSFYIGVTSPTVFTV